MLGYIGVPLIALFHGVLFFLFSKIKHPVSQVAILGDGLNSHCSCLCSVPAPVLKFKFWEMLLAYGHVPILMVNISFICNNLIDSAGHKQIIATSKGTLLEGFKIFRILNMFNENTMSAPSWETCVFAWAPPGMCLWDSLGNKAPGLPFSAHPLLEASAVLSLSHPETHWAVRVRWARGWEDARLYGLGAGWGLAGACLLESDCLVLHLSVQEMEVWADTSQNGEMVFTLLLSIYEHNIFLQCLR